MNTNKVIDKNSLEIAYEITVISNRLNELRAMIEDRQGVGLKDEAKEKLRERFWTIVKELAEKLEPYGNDWRSKAFDLATRHRACLTCLENMESCLNFE